MVAATLALVGAGVACEPFEPSATFVVNTVEDLSDANPGDGICEATEGAGDCTLRAAIEEGNGLGIVVVEVGSVDYTLSSPLVVTGSIAINPGGTTLPSILGSQDIYVVDGAALWLERFWAIDATIQVDGGLIVERSNVLGVETPIFVRDMGVAEVHNSRVLGDGLVSLLNRGTLKVSYSDVGGLLTGSAQPAGTLHTEAEGTTFVQGSWLASSCSGLSPISGGYNADNGGFCNLGGVGDINEGVAPLAPAGSHPQISAPPATLIDAVPLGELGCSTQGGMFDVANQERPLGFSCDIGSYEAPPIIIN